MNGEISTKRRKEVECESWGSLIRPKFKTGNHLIMACGRLVLSPTKSYYITVPSKVNANINIKKVLSETQTARFVSVIHVRVQIRIGVFNIFV